MAKFEELPQGMVKLLKGENVGKLVTEVTIELKDPRKEIGFLCDI